MRGRRGETIARGPDPCLKIAMNASMPGGVGAISWREEGLISVASTSAKGVVAILRVEPDARADDPMRGVYRWEVTVDDVVESGRAYTPRTARADAAAALEAIQRRSNLLLTWSTLACLACTSAAIIWMAN